VSAPPSRVIGTSSTPGGVPARRFVRPRFFASSPGQPRFRRATDMLLLVAASLAIAGLTLLRPPSGVERSLLRFLRSLPAWLDPVWRLLYDGLVVWVVLVVLAALVARRLGVLGEAAIAVAVAVGVSVVLFRLALGTWPGAQFIEQVRVTDETFPPLRVAAAAALALTAAPHLVRPLRSVARWAIAAGVVGAILGQGASPTAALAAFLVGVVAATAVRLAFGTSAGYPADADVIAAAAELGVDARSLEPPLRQPEGVFLARGEDGDGRPLLIKVYGRDAYDTQLLEKVWRTLWYRRGRARVRVTRLQAVEHEALITLLARGAGVAGRDVIAAGESSSGDAAVVFRDATLPIAGGAAGPLDDAMLASGWRALESLAAARIAHMRVDPTTVVASGGVLGLVDFDAAVIGGLPEQLLTDRAQMLASTAAVVGPERAISAASAALGADGVAQVLPYLQPATLGPALRAELRAAGVDTDDLREQAASAVGATPPKPLQLRRVTWWTLAQVALLAFAISSIVGALSGVDYADIPGHLEDARWGWLAAAFVLAQTPRLTQAIATLGSVSARLPFMPVYTMQLATGYMNLALPSNLARMALNIRFFQRQGVSAVAAVTAGAIDSLVSTVMQAALLVVLLVFSESSIDLGLELPSGPSAGALAIVAAIAVAALAVLALVGRLRRGLTDRVRRWWPEVREAVIGLRGSNRLGLLLGGSLATEVLFAASLGLFAAAFGQDVSFADLLLINIIGSLLASVIPVPGGIGVTEFAITAGLASTGVPEDLALVIALLYRSATFYLPPIWGFFALRWLNRNALL
jgi:uncharacterized membrane protein YbhN (UPF0104 family)